MVFGLVVMVYTGLLLQGTGGVAFWNSPLLPALLLLSSASSGAALVLVGGLLPALEFGGGWRASHPGA